MRTAVTPKEKQALENAIKAYETAIVSIEAGQKYCRQVMDRYPIHTRELKDRVAEMKSILKHGWA